jgi:hypothetical protein
MKNLSLATLLILSCVNAWAADFDKGSAAYEAGDFATALAEWKPLAEQGSALKFLGWYRHSDKVGVALAQNSLGIMYENGEGVREDDKKAVKWYRLAAEQGNAKAQSNLGFMYDGGFGGIEDHKKAAKWYRLAAKQGDASDQYALVLSYKDREGAREDGKNRL